ADDPRVLAMAERTAARVVTFGLRPGATVRADGVALGREGRAAFTLVTPAGTAPVRLRLVGAPNVLNALAAAAIAGELGMPVTEVAEGLSDATPRSKWRMEVTERADGVTVINDAYNANPEGMAAALETLATVARGRRAFAVLGPMNELGDESRRRHEEAGGAAPPAGGGGAHLGGGAARA